MSSTADFTLAAAIPVYNGAAYLGEAIESAKAQTIAFSQISVVDDASTDGTPQVIAIEATRGAISTSRLSQRVPAPGAWNAAVRSTRCTHVVVLAHDDILEPEFCRVAMQTLAQYPELDVLAFGHQNITSTGELREKCPMRTTGLPVGSVLDNEQYLDHFCSKGQMFLPSAVVMSRRIFDLLDGFDERLKVAYDWDFYLRCGAVGAKIMLHPDVLCRYRIHETQSVSSFTRQDNGDNTIIFHKLTELGKTMSQDHIRMLVDGMCEFMRQMVSRAVRDTTVPIDQVLSLRSSVINTMLGWKSQPLPQAAYISVTPASSKKRFAWFLMGSRPGIVLLRSVLKIASKSHKGNRLPCD